MLRKSAIAFCPWYWLYKSLFSEGILAEPRGLVDSKNTNQLKYWGGDHVTKIQETATWKSAKYCLTRKIWLFGYPRTLWFSWFTFRGKRLRRSRSLQDRLHLSYYSSYQFHISASSIKILKDIPKIKSDHECFIYTHYTFTNMVKGQKWENISISKICSLNINYRSFRNFRFGEKNK